MGREVRRVPSGYEHPRDKRGNYVPLFDGRGYAGDLAYFEAHEAEWRASYGDDLGGETRPDPARYTEAFPLDTATAYCIYETVSEGTPWSPVFDEPEALLHWLVVSAGYEPEAAAKFLVAGWAPSFVGTIGGELRDGIASFGRSPC